MRSRAIPTAGPGGWIRTEATGATQGELELRFTREKVHERALAQLEAWRADPPPNLVGVSSVSEQYCGLINQDDGNGVGIQHTEERQDRSAARAYATWSGGKLRDRRRAGPAAAQRRDRRPRRCAGTPPSGACRAPRGAASSVPSSAAATAASALRSCSRRSATSSSSGSSASSTRIEHAVRRDLDVALALRVA